MSFSAVVILTDEETRQLTDAGGEIYPMKWVDTGKNAHLQGDNDHVCVHSEHKGRVIGHGDFETTEGLRADPPAVMWIPTILFAVCVHKLTSPVTHAIQ